MQCAALYSDNLSTSHGTRVGAQRAPRKRSLELPDAGTFRVGQVSAQHVPFLAVYVECVAAREEVQPRRQDWCVAPLAKLLSTYDSEASSQLIHVLIKQHIGTEDCELSDVDVVVGVGTGMRTLRMSSAERVASSIPRFRSSIWR